MDRFIASSQLNSRLCFLLRHALCMCVNMITQSTYSILLISLYDAALCQLILQELLNLNIIKGATEVVGSQTLMGRAMIHISRFSEDPCQQFDDW